MDLYLIMIVIPAGVVLALAYWTYGGLLARLLELDPRRTTPAEELRDDLDFEPIAPATLFPQHFSAIAAAGPIVGPILAGKQFGWLPALLWILIGSILIGGVHDITSLVASIRHKARSIAEVVRDHMSRLSYLLFLSFIWIALVYIIVAFTDVTASTFVGAATEENGGVGGGAIASSSLLYLLLSIAMGLLVRYGRWSLERLTIPFLLLVALAIGVGRFIPLDVAGSVPVTSAPEVEQSVGKLLQARAAQKAAAAKQPVAEITEGELENRVRDYIRNFQAQRFWNIALLVYCLVAGVVPVWMLLQPRGHLGGYFLYFALGAGALGLILGGLKVEYPMIRFDESGDPAKWMFPMLFITIACGACSGFHSLIASGTTSKQLRCEPDAKVVGYGSMLLEGMVAVVSLCCVMMFAPGAAELSKSPNEIYAAGISRFSQVLGVPPGYARAFALMAFTTFVYDTLDVCTRLGRFIVQELLGMPSWLGRMIGTTLTAAVPLFFLLRHPVDAPQPVYMIFWSLFGASNQLLAALTLLGVTVWLWKTKRAMWVWPVVGLPAVWMYAMSTWALVVLSLKDIKTKDGTFVSFVQNPVPYIGMVLLVLALVMLMEALRVIFFPGENSAPPPETVLAPAHG